MSRKTNHTRNNIVAPTSSQPKLSTASLPLQGTHATSRYTVTLFFRCTVTHMLAKDGKSSNTIMTMVTEGDLITRYYTDCPKTEPVRINYKNKTGQILIFRPMKSLSCSIFNIQCFMPVIYFHLICKSFQLNLQWAVLHACDIFLSSHLQKFPHTWPSNCSTILDLYIPHLLQAFISCENFSGRMKE